MKYKAKAKSLFLWKYHENGQLKITGFWNSLTIPFAPSTFHMEFPVLKDEEFQMIGMLGFFHPK